MIIGLKKQVRNIGFILTPRVHIKTCLLNATIALKRQVSPFLYVTYLIVRRLNSS